MGKVTEICVVAGESDPVKGGVRLPPINTASPLNGEASPAISFLIQVTKRWWVCASETGDWQFPPERGHLTLKFGGPQVIHLGASHPCRGASPAQTLA